ncbi:hypothetical protein llap_15148 [Limosa lapponica baueri]|uniref:PLAT domain-containing protein n=1 Tax=Limosa lapponica baueri TaxID=1758121 RepID=A0A2I0TL62_LIMLA|nr:hypothetical protein llap_15148 [Limosa lapponica baueri]
MPTWHKEIKFKAGTYIKRQKFLIRQSVDLPCTTSDSFLEMTSKKSSDGRNLSAVYKYVVSVHIGDRWGAETFANVSITLYGKRGDTGVRKLRTSLAKGRKFQRNKFTCQSCTITARIMFLGRRLTSSPKLPEINMKPSGLWIMDITGSDLSNEEDPICLSFIFYGNLSRKKFPLQVTGKAIQIKDELADVGSIHKVQVTGPHSELKQPWRLDLLHMKHTGTKEEMYLAFDCWFNPYEDKCVELPALYADQEPLPDMDSEYIFAFNTETSVTSLLTKDFDTKSRGRWQMWMHCMQVPEDVPDIQVVLFGRKGKSPAQKVQNLNDNPFLLTVGDIGDIMKVSFVLSGPCLGRGIKLHKVCTSEMRAVDLGQLNKVLVEHHNVGYGAGWYLDQIVIHESGKTDDQYAFLCQQWLDSGVGDAQTKRMLKLLGKVRNGMLTGKIYGIISEDQKEIKPLQRNSDVSLGMLCPEGLVQAGIAIKKR